MRYHNPVNVTSPRDVIKNVTVIFDGGEGDVSIAKINWDGDECIGMRWNVARREWDDPDKISETKICAGMPSSHSYPVWFIIPNDLFDNDSDMYKAIKDK